MRNARTYQEYKNIINLVVLTCSKSKKKVLIKICMMSENQYFLIDGILSDMIVSISSTGLFFKTGFSVKKRDNSGHLFFSGFDTSLEKFFIFIIFAFFWSLFSLFQNLELLAGFCVHENQIFRFWKNSQIGFSVSGKTG